MCTLVILLATASSLGDLRQPLLQYIGDSDITIIRMFAFEVAKFKNENQFVVLLIRWAQ